MQFYAIKHIASGELMPAKMFRTSAGGFSHWEPNDEHYGGCTTAPRLFTTIGTAKRAANSWALGKQQLDSHGDLVVLPSTRRNTDLQIVQVTLEISNG